LVGTPIGNLEDITLRSMRMLREADLIACEDTRHTQKLLTHYGITAQTTSYHEHNEAARAPQLIERMREGKRIALVSDAGMPGISDPGYRLVQLAIGSGIPVVPVAGPSAALAALVASGLPTNAFQFVGFLPPKPNARRKFLDRLASSTVATIAFESPHRVLATLRDILSVLGDRPVAVARELTKIHEEFLRGRCVEVIAALRARPRVQGEITLVIGPASDPTVLSLSGEAADRQDSAPISEAISLPVKERVRQLMEQRDLSRMEALKAVARERGISKSEAYRQFES